MRIATAALVLLSIGTAHADVPVSDDVVVTSDGRRGFTCRKPATSYDFVAGTSAEWYVPVAFEDPPSCGSVTPNGAIVVLGDSNATSVVAVTTNKELFRIDRGSTYKAAASNDGSLFAIEAPDGMLEVYDVRSKKRSARTKVDSSSALLFTPNNQLLVAEWSQLRVIDRRGRTKRVGKIQMPGRPGTWKGWAAFSLVLSPDGKRVAAGGVGGIHVFAFPSLAHETSLGEDRPKDASFWAPVWSPDGTRILAGGRTEGIRLFDVATTDVLATRPGRLLGRCGERALAVIDGKPVCLPFDAKAWTP